jgi:branched-chain amino acid transport system substrate-binding protein
VAGPCVLALLALLALAVVACSDDAEPAAGTSLGSVVVAEGEAIQIRALLYTSGAGGTGVANLRAVRLAVEHYGPIAGFDVHVGVPLNDRCSSDGGRGAAETILADADVVGVIGTSCSVAAVEAAPLLTGAGMVMISPTTSSPTLTSDLAGNPSEHYHAGYYRTAHNDLHQGAAVAHFLRHEHGIGTAAAVHTGDVYTRSLAEAFAAAFERLGGEVSAVRQVSRVETDMAPALAGIALGSPEALFLPVSGTVGESIVAQAPDVAGMEDVLLIAPDGLLSDDFMMLPETEGLFFSGPAIDFGDNRNESTGKSAARILADYEDSYGVLPNSAFWGHAYDATTLLLEAIEASSEEVYAAGLRIDRAALRGHLDGVADYSGVIGNISCDGFGDCGLAKIAVIEHLDATDIPASRVNTVYEYAP